MIVELVHRKEVLEIPEVDRRLPEFEDDERSDNSDLRVLFSDGSSISRSNRGDWPQHLLRNCHFIHFIIII